jgi:hypothetical protein
LEYYTQVLMDTVAAHFQSCAITQRIALASYETG